MTEKIEKSDAEWQAELTPEQYPHARARRAPSAPSPARIGTSNAPGLILASCCGQELFASDTKYDSGYGLAELLPADRRRTGSRPRPTAACS